MSEPTETYEEQVLRVLNEMVLSGEILTVERDGEVYFKINEETDTL